MIRILWKAITIFRTTLFCANCCSILMQENLWNWCGAIIFICPGETIKITNNTTISPPLRQIKSTALETAGPQKNRLFRDWGRASRLSYANFRINWFIPCYINVHQSLPRVDDNLDRLARETKERRMKLIGTYLRALM